MGTEEPPDAGDPGDPSTARGRAVEEFDQRLVDLLAWLLDTETRARIYIYLRSSPGHTSEEIAEGTGLYPSTVRESLAALTDDGIVAREKRQNEGAGNNPFEYTAIPPSDLVGNLVAQVQDELNTICHLDDYLGDGAVDDTGPVSIEVRDADDA